MNDALVIVGGARTPFGAFGGGLAAMSATDLAVAATKGAMARTAIDPQMVDQVVMGNVIQSSKDAIYLARHVVLRCGMKVSTPGLIVNLLCGSSVYSVATAGMLIASKQATMVVAGGTDALSMTPYISWGMRWGARMGHQQLWDGLDIRDTVPSMSMGETAEVLQQRYEVSRRDQDEFALRSQQLCRKAAESGRLAEEIVPVDVVDAKGRTKTISVDEHPRPDTTIEMLSVLKPVFKKDGTISAGNSCGIVDGATALVVTSADNAEKLGLNPLCRVVSWAVEGVPPEIMGIGPVAAIPAALSRAGLTLEQMDLIEINEAFAAQYIACERDLKLDREKVNLNGGAIALGHPFGASGARLLLTMAIELKKRKARYGIAGLCVGGGMGIAMVITPV